MRDAPANHASLAVIRMLGDGFGEPRAARIGVAQRDHVKIARGHACEKDRGFVGLCAGLGKEALL